MFVQFSDESRAKVVSVFGSPQNPEEYPHQGEIEEDDPRYLAFLAPHAADPLAEFTNAVQSRLDEFARSRGYDGILSACTYAGSTVDRFRVEGRACVEARDGTWAKCYEIFAAVEAGERPVLSLAELLAELPALTWP